MNTEMKHTPTPWHNDLSGNPDSGGWIWTAQHGQIIATTFTHEIGEEKAIANAEFITLACNSYHPDQAKIKALTEALELLALAVERMNDSPAGPAVLAMRTQEARAALSLAKS